MLNSVPHFSQMSRAFCAGVALEALRHFGEDLGVDLDAGGFHARQHRRHGEIDVVVDACCSPALLTFVAQLGGEAQGEVGGFGERCRSS